MERTTTNRIPFWLNLLLTLAFLVQSIAMYMFHRRNITEREATISTLPYVRDHKWVELSLGIIAIIIPVVLFIWIFREVWNRVIANLVTVPQLTFSEVYALTILLFAITLWFTP